MFAVSVAPSAKETNSPTGYIPMGHPETRRSRSYPYVIPSRACSLTASRKSVYMQARGRDRDKSDKAGIRLCRTPRKAHLKKN